MKKSVFMFAMAFLLSAVWQLKVFGESFEFRNKEISEILYTVSLYKNFPVTCDDSVDGKADFRYAGGNFEDAFDAFVVQNRLYVEKKDDKWVVSRVRLEKNEEGQFCLDAFDVSPALVLEKISIASGIFISWDGLPLSKISIHTGFSSCFEIVEKIVSLCKGFSCKKSGDSEIREIKIERNGEKIGAEKGSLEKFDFSVDENGMWKCDIQNASLIRAVEKLCQLGKKEYSIVSGGDGKITRSYYGGKTFDQMLKIICLHGGCQAVFSQGIYYISAIKDAKNRLSASGKNWEEISFDFLKSENALSLLGKRFPSLEMIGTGKNMVLVRCTEEEKSEIEEFAKKIDAKNDCFLVELKYLKTGEFFEHLPPFIEKSSVFDSGDGKSFYFAGTKEKYNFLMEKLSEFDKPVTTVTYDLLIMQYQSSAGSQWSPSISARRVSMGDVTQMSTTLGSVLDLSVDVISAFGLSFAASLQSAISETKARVFADTTLHGISGGTINFQNTNTYRYRDNNLDPKTGKPIYSGVTKEISSGLKLEVTGFVTGDGMIRSKITASVSRQGEDTSSSTGNPPPTSEKIITTEVLAHSGEPVILSGLVQNEMTEAVRRMPLISKIPVLGWIFKARDKIKEKTELVIYLVPSFSVKEDKEEDFNQKEYIQGILEKYLT